ncbi:MAG TPA: GNAT family N-acetyltransferase [Bacteroidia bacterium]|nr:GNAT family N-acetyltransferase [Bacteroidia bacterium]
MNWIKPGTILNGAIVELVPLEEKHFEELVLLAGEKRIWEFIPVDMTTKEKCFEIFDDAILEREKGFQFPFVIVHKKEKKIIGSTRLMNIERAHKKLEIGWTWLFPDYWSTTVNLECKLLLLTFCFEELEAVRVQLKTDENNIRSRKAIEKIRGQYEGVLRHDLIRANGTIRNSAYFSLINTEWDTAKQNLANLLEAKTN